MFGPQQAEEWREGPDWLKQLEKEVYTNDPTEDLLYMKKFNEIAARARRYAETSSEPVHFIPQLNPDAIKRARAERGEYLTDEQVAQVVSAASEGLAPPTFKVQNQKISKKDEPQEASNSNQATQRSIQGTILHS